MNIRARRKEWAVSMNIESNASNMYLTVCYITDMFDIGLIKFKVKIS